MKSGMTYIVCREKWSHEQIFNKVKIVVSEKWNNICMKE